jgi:hypothetical protein
MRRLVRAVVALVVLALGMDIVPSAQATYIRHLVRPSMIRLDRVASRSS